MLCYDGDTNDGYTAGRGRGKRILDRMIQFTLYGGLERGRYRSIQSDIDEAARRIRRMKDPEKARVLIVAMTANAFEED